MGFRAFLVGAKVDPTKHTPATDGFFSERTSMHIWQHTASLRPAAERKQNAHICGTGADTYEHLHKCSALDETKRELEADTKVSAGAWEHATLFFRKRIDGTFFALVLAVYAAAWAIRGYRRRVGGGRGGGKLKDTIRKLLDCPWLTGCATNTTRKERRSRRMRPPIPIGRAVRYRSDGASRREHGESVGRAGYGTAAWRTGESGEPHAWFRASRVV